jgi:hypothetical protein
MSDEDSQGDWRVELTCLKCNRECETEWSFGKDVTCPHCKTTWETVWDTDADDNISGPWITNEKKP